MPGASAGVRVWARLQQTMFLKGEKRNPIYLTKGMWGIGGKKNDKGDGGSGGGGAPQLWGEKGAQTSYFLAGSYWSEKGAGLCGRVRSKVSVPSGGCPWAGHHSELQQEKVGIWGPPAPKKVGHV